MGLLLSEWLKTKRTAMRWMTFAMPMVFSLAVIAYAALRTDCTQNLVFQVFFEAWTAFVIPLYVSVMAAFIIQEEEQAGVFMGFLSTSISRNKLYLGKFLLLFLCMTISTMIALITLSIGINFILPGGINSLIFTSAAILVIFGTLPLPALHLWISFAWGTGASIGVGMSELVIAALIGTTELGDKIWMLIPWAWPSRLAKLPGTYLNFTPDMQTPPVEIASGSIFSQLSTGSIMVIICLIVLIIGGVIWFNKWEGRKHYE